MLAEVGRKCGQTSRRSGKSRNQPGFWVQSLHKVERVMHVFTDVGVDFKASGLKGSGLMFRDVGFGFAIKKPMSEETGFGRRFFLGLKF